MSIEKNTLREIMGEYERIRSKNEDIRDQRKREVILKVPEYKELEDEAAEAASYYGKKSIAGDDTALASLHERMEEIARKKEKLMQSAGFPADYLAPIRGMSVRRNAIA